MEKKTKLNTPWPKWAAMAVGMDVNGLYDRALDAWESGEDADTWRQQHIVKPALTLAGLEDALRELVPDFSCEYDNFGQIVIYTGRMLSETGTLVPLVFDERDEPEGDNHDAKPDE